MLKNKGNIRNIFAELYNREKDPFDRSFPCGFDAYPCQYNTVPLGLPIKIVVKKLFKTWSYIQMNTFISTRCTF